MTDFVDKEGDKNNKDLYLVVDIESTGLIIGIDRVIEVCILETDGTVVRKTVHFTVKINDTLLDKAYRELSHVIKIDRQAIKNSKTSLEVFSEINNYFEEIIKNRQNANVYIVGHNVSFDYKAILAELNINNISSQFGRFFAGRQIDTRTLAKNQLPDLNSYSLDSVAMFLGIENLIKKRAVEGHSAILDVLITFEVFKKLNRKVIFSL